MYILSSIRQFGRTVVARDTTLSLNLAFMQMSGEFMAKSRSSIHPFRAAY